MTGINPAYTSQILIRNQSEKFHFKIVWVMCSSRAERRRKCCMLYLETRHNIYLPKKLTFYWQTITIDGKETNNFFTQSLGCYCINDLFLFSVLLMLWNLGLCWLWTDCLPQGYQILQNNSDLLRSVLFICKQINPGFSLSRSCSTSGITPLPWTHPRQVAGNWS